MALAGRALRLNSSFIEQLTGRLCETGEAATLTIEKGKIASVERGPASVNSASGNEVWISPGFIDFQVNGYGGHDFNKRFWAAEGKESPEETVSHIVESAARAGTTQLCPTICTNSHEAMVAGLQAVAIACDSHPVLAEAIPALHVEGPYIGSEDGPRGAHPLQHVRDPDWDEFLRFQEAAGGRIKLFTLAPEREGALPFIEKLVEAGVTVAIGHTGATPERIRDAVMAGARLSTHLGNGAHAQLPRHPNYIWEQLASDDLYTSIIADGHHLPESVVKCMARVKRADRLILVSDAVALGGLPPGIYNDGRHEILPSGKVVLAGTPYLAGAGHLLDTCAANLLRYTDRGMAGLAKAASTNPARLLGLDDHKGRIASGYDADLTLFKMPEGEGPLDIQATVRGGNLVHGII